MARIENKRITISKATITEYKGNKVLTLNPEGRTNFSFGLGKAMLILENLPEICAFLKSDGKSFDLSEEDRKAISEIAAKYLPKV